MYQLCSSSCGQNRWTKKQDTTLAEGIFLLFRMTWLITLGRRTILFWFHRIGDPYRVYQQTFTIRWHHAIIIYSTKVYRRSDGEENVTSRRRKDSRHLNSIFPTFFSVKIDLPFSSSLPNTFLIEGKDVSFFSFTWLCWNNREREREGKILKKITSLPDCIRSGFLSKCTHTCHYTCVSRV